MKTRLARIHVDLYKLLDNDSKNKKVTMTMASRDVAKEMYNARVLAKKIDADLIKGTNKKRLWFFK